MKIYLIGYMGSGKSTIGTLLAEKMKLDFIDFDSYIENETGQSIIEIFNTYGESGFRELEHKYLKKVLDKDNLVISLGGGTPCFYNNMDIINNTGTSFYLNTGVNILVQRLSKEKNKRPLIKSFNDTELLNFIQTNLEKRKKDYEKANYTIEATFQNANQIVQEIKRKIQASAI